MAPERPQNKKASSTASDRKVRDDKKRSVVSHHGSETETKLPVVNLKGLNGHSSGPAARPTHLQNSPNQPQPPVRQKPLVGKETSARNQITAPVEVFETNQTPVRWLEGNTSSAEPTKSITSPSKPPNGVHSPQQQFARVPLREFQQCYELLCNHANDFSYPKLISEAKAFFAENLEDKALCCVQQALLLLHWQELHEENREGFFKSLTRGQNQKAREFNSSLKDLSALLRQASPPKQSPARSLRSRPRAVVADSRASAFFKTGKVFSTVQYELASRHQNAIRSYICRMVVVREFSGSCICLPIYSYGGRGLAWDGLSETDARCHAIIGMRDAMPQLMPGEHRPTIRPIVVEPTTGATLESSSRLNFVAPQKVEHKSRVTDLGSVADESLQELLRFFREMTVGAGKFVGSNHIIR